MSSVKQVLQTVQTVQEAQEVIAALTERFAAQTAVDAFQDEGRYQKRPWRTVAFHTAGNLLRYGRTRRFKY